MMALHNAGMVAEAAETGKSWVRLHLPLVSFPHKRGSSVALSLHSDWLGCGCRCSDPMAAPPLRTGLAGPSAVAGLALSLLALW